MEALFRKVRKSPAATRDTTGKSKHQKLGEGWEENREAVTEGVTFYLKYLGSTLLDELPEGESYGEGVSTKAVQRIVDMAKSVGKKLKKVCLTITPKGIKVVDMVTKEVSIDLSIYRISFCTADKNHDKVFAFIARNTINETMECHAYFCAKRKIAQAVTLSVSQAFRLAKDKWEKYQKLKDSSEIKSQSDVSKKQAEKRLQADENSNVSSSPNRSEVTVDIECHPRLPKPDGRNSPLHSNRSNSPADSQRHRGDWLTFGDDDENLDDSFSRLANLRSRGSEPLLSTEREPMFSTDLCQDDLDDSVQQYMDGTKCFEEFSRQKSMEDLLNI